jgi:hypothetical protein
MPIPDYQTLMLPLLRLLKDREEHSNREVIDNLGSEFNLSDAEMKELLPSGQQEVFHNRVGWARTYLKKAKLVEATRRGHFRISDLGLKVLSKEPKRIDVKFLDQFDEFRQFRASGHTRNVEGEAPETDDSEITPEEALETAYKRLRDSLASDLLLQNMAKVFVKMKVLGREDFHTQDGESGVKILVENELQGRMLRQTFHFIGPGIRKYVMTCTALADGGDSFDKAFSESAETFRIH